MENVDANQIAQWLDAHPDFLSDYFRKSHAKQRCDSIISEYLTLSNENNDDSTLNALPFLNKSNRDRRASNMSILLKNTRHLNSNNTSNNNQAITTGFASLLAANQKINLSLSEPNMIRAPIGSESSNSSSPAPRSPINRNKFKQLSLYEKMYTLVKALYQSLDMRITCKKILNTVSLLLDADRCSLFLVVDDDQADDEQASGDQNKSNNKKCLISVVFDAKSKHNSAPDLFEQNGTIGEIAKEDYNEDEDDDDDEQIKIPYGVGIAGHVASLKQALNIEDAYSDARFNPKIDQQTGYRTKSILCLPILNEIGECIAVAEAINKIGDLYSAGDCDEDNRENIEKFEPISFSNEDEEIFAKFMPFISIAIRNSNLYAQSRREAQTNKFLLELATIVFDESTSTVDNLVSRILFNSLYLLECEKCQIILLNRDININNNINNGASLTNNSSSNHTLLRRRRTLLQDVNKFFDRVYELSFDELSLNKHLTPITPNFSASSAEFGIIRDVVKSGEILNIQNKNNLQYNLDSSIKSLLCIPVLNSENQTVAILFAKNKIQNETLLNENGFSRQDLNIAQAFALFCGIGIQNIMMYEKVVQASNMQQVALDVLSYHVSSCQDDVNKLLEENIPEPAEFGLRSFLFDENTLDDMGTLKACISMFADLGLIEQFKIPYEVMCRFFLTVKKNYRPVAYHNWRHGFNVMSAMYTMFTTGNYRDLYNDLEILSLLIACICHDLDHRGTTNKFQLKIQSPLAKLYSTSTMEHHHFNQCIIILHNTSNNILTNLTSTQHSTAIDLIEKAILATDLSLHFQKFDTFQEKASASGNSSDSFEDKDLLMNMLMTACDLSGATKPWRCHYRLSNLVANEFFTEGDLEKERFNREPIDSMNRNKSDQLPQMQIQFIQSVCLPLYESLSKCNAKLQILVKSCEDNIEEWRKLVLFTKDDQEIEDKESDSL